MDNGSPSLEQVFELVAHHRIPKLAFATASRKKSDQLYASQIYIRVVRAFLEHNTIRPLTNVQCAALADSWDSFISKVLFEPYREHCTRKHRSDLIHASEILHPKILTFPLGALRFCLSLMKEFDYGVYAALVALRPGYAYSYSELRPLLFGKDSDATKAYRDTLADCFVTTLLQVEEEELFVQQGNFVRLVKSPFKHFDELGAFFELDKNGLAQTISLLCLADTIEVYGIEERQVEPFVTRKGEILPSGYDPGTLAVLWKNHAQGCSKRLFLELPAILLRKIHESHEELYLPLVRSFGAALKSEKDEESALAKGLAVPLEFPEIDREKARFEEILNCTKSGLDSTEAELSYSFEVQLNEQDLSRDIARYKTLLVRKERECSLRPQDRRELIADMERIRGKISSSKRARKKAQSRLKRVESEYVERHIEALATNTLSEKRPREVQIALEIVDRELPKQWRKLQSKERKLVLRDPVSAAHCRISLHRSRKAKLLAKLSHSLDYKSLCLEVPGAKKVLDDLQIASSLENVSWQPAQCTRYSRREVLSIAIWEKLFTESDIELSRLQSIFPEDRLLVNLIFQRNRLQRQLEFYVEGIKSCFVELFEELRKSLKEVRLDLLQQERAVRTLFTAVWDWVGAQIVNPYQERLNGVEDNEEEVERAKSYSFWLLQQLAPVLEESYPGLFAYLVLDRPTVVYSSHSVRDFVWQENADRAHYIRILSSNLIKRLSVCPDVNLGESLEEFLNTLGSPFSIFLDETVTSLDEFSDELFEFTDSQSEKIDSRTRRYMVGAWANRNELLWRGIGLQGGKLLSLILNEIQRHNPTLHTKLNVIITEKSAEKLKEIRDFRFASLPEARGAQRAELVEALSDLTSGIDELDYIHNQLLRTLVEVEQKGTKEVYGRVA